MRRASFLSLTPRSARTRAAVAWLLLSLGRASAQAPVDVFVASTHGFNNFRIPALLRTPSGTLIAFAEARTAVSDCEPKSLVFKRSEDNGTSWGALQTLAAPAAPATWVGNPTVVFDAQRNASLIVFAAGDAAHCNPGQWTFAATSGDEGATWSAPRDVSADVGAWAGALPGPGTAAQVPAGAPRAGRIVLPVHKGAYVADAVIFSDDGGATWAAGATALPLMDEAVVAALADGTLLLNMRNNHASPCDCRAVSRSSDGGASFATPVAFDAALIEPVCQGSLVALGGALFFANPASRTARANLTVRRSDDGGATWLPQTFLVNAPKSAGYSCLAAGAPTAVAADGRALGSILYESMGASGRLASISFRLFPLDLGPV